MNEGDDLKEFLVLFREKTKELAEINDKMRECERERDKRYGAYSVAREEADRILKGVLRPAEEKSTALYAGYVEYQQGVMQDMGKRITEVRSEIQNLYMQALDSLIASTVEEKDTRH